MSKEFHSPEKEAQLEFYKCVGEQLRIKRTYLSLTQEDVAWLMNVSRVSVNNIEAGKQRAPLHFLFAMCNLLEIQLQAILKPYNYGIKSFDELRAFKAKKRFNKICNHEAIEEIETVKGDKYFICPICNYSKKL